MWPVGARAHPISSVRAAHSVHEQCVEDVNKSVLFFFLLNIIIGFHGIVALLPSHCQFLQLQREG